MSVVRIAHMKRLFSSYYYCLIKQYHCIKTTARMQLWSGNIIWAFKLNSHLQGTVEYVLRQINKNSVQHPLCMLPAMFTASLNIERQRSFRHNCIGHNMNLIQVERLTRYNNSRDELRMFGSEQWQTSTSHTTPIISYCFDAHHSTRPEMKTTSH